MGNKIGTVFRTCIFLLLCLALLATGAWAQDSAGEPGRHAKKPNPLNNVYFGEQHLHTQDSPDAFAMGTRNSIDDAYRFCKGEAIKKSTSGEMVQKKTPYDWCAVTDHAFMMGLLPLSLDPKSSISKSEIAKLIAFEWTSIPFGQNLHRNVFFRDDKGPEMPFSTIDSDRAEDLWTYLEVQRRMGHETFDVGVDTGSSVIEDYATRMPFEFDGTLEKVVIELSESKLKASHEKTLKEAKSRLEVGH